MTCTGARLATFFAMDSQLSVPRDVRRYPTEVVTLNPYQPSTHAASTTETDTCSVCGLDRHRRKPIVVVGHKCSTCGRIAAWAVTRMLRLAMVVILATLTLLAFFADVLVGEPFGSIITALCLPFIVLLAIVLFSSFCSPPECRIGNTELGPTAIGG